MRIFSASLAMSVLLAGSTAMFAGTIPYPGGGQILTNTPITATGSSVVFFYGFSASDTDMIDIFDTTSGTQTGDIFTNQGAGSSSPGSSVSIATNSGDNLVVEIINTSTGKDYYSELGFGAPTTLANGGLFLCAGSTTQTAGCQPANSSDGDQHAYVTSYAGGVIPGTSINPGAGTFVGMEDLDSTNGTDWDYNDDQFILTGVTAQTTAVTPEPTSIALFGTGILGMAGIVRRKFSGR